MTVLETLLQDLPTDWQVSDVYVGANWILALANDADGNQHAGVASTPKTIAPESRFQIGHYTLNETAEQAATLLRSSDAAEAAVGLAVINALHQPEEALLSTADAADWLSTQCVNRTIALFGRFPFIDGEIRPIARQVWVFEQAPQQGEFSSADIPRILPQADIVAITGSSIINHTIDQILPYVPENSTVVLLGPSVPLSPQLLDCGIDAIFGVQVTDVEQVIQSVIAGEGFQKMRGLQRVSLFK